MSLYRGFSTVGRNFKFKLTDFELAKQDLINHLHIAKGEKLMNPGFGTSIWAMIFENMTSDYKNEIVDEIVRVAKFDPRLTVSNVNVVEYEHGIQVELDVSYIGSISPTTLTLAFEKSSRTVTEI